MVRAAMSGCEAQAARIDVRQPVAVAGRGRLHSLVLDVVAGEPISAERRDVAPQLG